MTTVKSDRRNEHVDAFRREALIGTGCIVGLFGLGLGASASADDIVVRPPGATKEKFLSMCIKCGRCVAACHTGVVGVADLTQGLAQWRAPVMDYFKGYCDFCNRCIDVCPTSALSGYLGETDVVGTAKINDGCIAVRTGGCTKCYEECPYDAITLDSVGRPVIDESVCNGCGKCVYVCPAHVFQSFVSGEKRGVSIVAVKVGEEAS